MNDIIQKYANGLFRNATLEFYGIKTAKIKELINVELPVVEMSESSTDYIFLLEDDSYLHFEFQSTYNKRDLIRFAGYDVRLYERDERNISTVIIYTSNVTNAETDLNIGSIKYTPEKIMMCNYDGDRIYKELEMKITAAQELNDLDMLNLIFLPLMKNNIPKEELAVKSIQLAQTISDAAKRNTCIAAAFAFANKYLNEGKINELLEAMKMTDLATLLVGDAVDNAVRDAEYKRNIEIAKNLLKENVHIKIITKSTGLDETTIKRLETELNNE